MIPAVVVGVCTLAWASAPGASPHPAVAVAGFLVRSPATLIHEFAHAATATLSGGIATGIRMTSATEARVDAVHFTLASRMLTPAAGYVLAPAYGLALAALGVFGEGEPWAGVPFAATTVIAALCLLLSRNWLALGASSWLLAASAWLMVTGAFAPEWLGLVLCVTSSVAAIELAALHLRHGRGARSDATEVAGGIFPPSLHALAWAALSVASVSGCVWLLATPR